MPGYHEHNSVDIIIVNHNDSRYIRRCFNRIRELDFPPDLMNIYWLDNASSDSSVEMVREIQSDYPIPITILQAKRNLGFPEANNRAIREGTSEFIFLLNQDTEVHPDCLKNLVETMNEDASIGIAEARQVPDSHPKYYDEESRQTSWCCCGGSLVRRTAFVQVGEFEGHFFYYCDDVDLGWKLWLAGWKCVFVKEASYVHYSYTHVGIEKRPRAFYFTLRNGILMRYAYCGPWSTLKYVGRLFHLLIAADESALQKKIILRALFSHVPHIPHFLRRWSAIRNLKTPAWIQFRGLYEFGPLPGDISDNLRTTRYRDRPGEGVSERCTNKD